MQVCLDLYDDIISTQGQNSWPIMWMCDHHTPPGSPRDNFKTELSRSGHSRCAYYGTKVDIDAGTYLWCKLWQQTQAKIVMLFSFCSTTWKATFTMESIMWSVWAELCYAAVVHDHVILVLSLRDSLDQPFLSKKKEWWGAHHAPFYAHWTMWSRNHPLLACTMCSIPQAGQTPLTWHVARHQC